MAIYKWAEGNGNIEEADYNRGDSLTYEQVQQELKAALSVFGHTVTCNPVSDKHKEVYEVSIPESIGDILICIKETTPGGRSSLKDEQRIQQKAKYLNYTYDQLNKGKKAFSFGVYKRGSNTIFCAWKVGFSNASDNTTISKQIKIKTIAEAMKYGFAQQPKKGKNDEYVCAFRKEYIYLFLRSPEKYLLELAESVIEINNEDIDNKTLQIVNLEYIKKHERKKNSNKQVIKKADYLKIFKNKMDFGRKGEELVMRYEENQIKSYNIDKNHKVEWVSEKDDSLGFDIKSYDKNGEEIHIEVKTSSEKGNVMKFYLTKNEHAKLKEDNYKIYYVFDLKSSQPKLHIVDMERLNNGEIEIDPEIFLVSWIVKKK